MKIAISGSVGIGKTTLAKQLAAELGVPLIEENYAPIFAAAGILKGPKHDLAVALLTIHEKKRRQESGYSGFVTDRCPVDVFNIWLNRGLGAYKKRWRNYSRNALNRSGNMTCWYYLATECSNLNQTKLPTTVGSAI